MDRRQVISAAAWGSPPPRLPFRSPPLPRACASSRWSPPGRRASRASATSAERVAQSITALSGGRLQVKVFAAGQLVGAFEVVRCRLVRPGRHVPRRRNYWEGRSAAFSYFAAVPFGFTAAEMNAWVYYGGGQALWDELSAGFGLKPFLCGNTGSTDGRLVHQGADQRRVLQGPAIPHARPRWRGAAAARRRGGQPAGWRDHPVAAVWRHRRERMGRPLGRHGVGAAQGGQVLLLSRLPRAWDGAVPRRQQEAVGQPRHAPSAASSRPPRRPRTAYCWRSTTPRTPSRSRSLPTIPAIKIRKFDDAILQSLGKITGEVLAETSRKDDLTRRVYDSFMKFRAATVRWGDISERAYLNARALKFPFGG